MAQCVKPLFEMSASHMGSLVGVLAAPLQSSFLLMHLGTVDVGPHTWAAAVNVWIPGLLALTSPNCFYYGSLGS